MINLAVVFFFWNWEVSNPQLLPPSPPIMHRLLRCLMFPLFPTLEKWKHKEVCLDEVFKGCVIFLEAATLEPETQVHGAVVIFDMEGLSLQQTWQFTPAFAKRIVDWLQDSVPLRIKGIHIVNQPKLFQIVFALFKPFLREKLRNRIIFHGTDYASVHKHISPKSVPAKYGGTSEVPRVSGQQWYDMLCQCDREYAAINSYGVRKGGKSKK